MKFRRVYLDSNVFIRAFEAPVDDDIAQDLIAMLGLIGIGQQPRFATSQITLAEVLVQPIRIGDPHKRDFYRRVVGTTSPMLFVRAVNQTVLELAAKIRATSKLKLPDAIHAASALSTNCSHILTADRDFVRHSEPNPTWPTVLHPTRENVDAIVEWLRG